MRCGGDSQIGRGGAESLSAFGPLWPVAGNMVDQILPGPA